MQKLRLTPPVPVGYLVHHLTGIHSDSRVIGRKRYCASSGDWERKCGEVPNIDRLGSFWNRLGGSALDIACKVAALDMRATLPLDSFYQSGIDEQNLLTT